MKARLIFLACSLVTSALISAAGCEDEGGGLSSNQGSPTGPGTGGAGTTGPGTGGSGTGGTALPSDCATYCDTILEVCVEENAMYANDAYCSDVCLEFPAGKDGAISGNSLACRTHYLAFATASPEDADINCRYAGPGTEGKCGGSCENFCFLAQRICTGEQAQWANDENCRADCEDFAMGSPYVVGATGDTYACRLYQLTLAADNPLEYCNKIGEDTEACVGPPPMPDGGMGGMGGEGGIGGGGGIGGEGGIGVGGMGGMMGVGGGSSSSVVVGVGGAGGI
jgi:hypothetical protein